MKCNRAELTRREVLAEDTYVEFIETETSCAVNVSREQAQLFDTHPIYGRHPVFGLNPGSWSFCLHAGVLQLPWDIRAAGAGELEPVLHLTTADVDGCFWRLSFRLLAEPQQNNWLLSFKDSEKSDLHPTSNLQKTPLIVWHGLRDDDDVAADPVEIQMLQLGETNECSLLFSQFNMPKWISFFDFFLHDELMNQLTWNKTDPEMLQRIAYPRVEKLERMGEPQPLEIRLIE